MPCVEFQGINFIYEVMADFFFIRKICLFSSMCILLILKRHEDNYQRPDSPVHMNKSLWISHDSRPEFLSFHVSMKYPLEFF